METGLFPLTTLYNTSMMRTTTVMMIQWGIGKGGYDAEHHGEDDPSGSNLAFFRASSP
jgi:hypothetical protein